MSFISRPLYERKRPTKVWKQKSKAVALLFIAESEGFEPPEPRRVQQISSLPRSTTPATFRCKNTTFFACLRLIGEIFMSVFARMSGYVLKARYLINPAQLVVWGRWHSISSCVPKVRYFIECHCVPTS